MNSNRFEILFQLCMDDRATAAEYLELTRLMSLPENEVQLRRLLDFSFDASQDRLHIVQQNPEAAARIFHAIVQADRPQKNTLPAKQPVRILLANKRWLKIAAIFIVFATVACMYFLNDNFKEHKLIVSAHAPAKKKNEIDPGSNKAFLHLPDGNTIALDSTDKIIQLENNFSIDNTGGNLNYKGKARTIAYHTLSTPRGGQYEMHLSDGSTAWLNAQSSISFPTFFSGKTRTVSVTGEVYFEVTKNTKMPFVVVADKDTIEVLGTNFDVSAYQDEEVKKITLLKGSVRVICRKGRKKIMPGQQAVVGADSLKVLDHADIQKVIGWQQGKFEFNNITVAELLRQISRWYDVDIRYTGSVPEKKLGGAISKFVPLTTVLKMLEANGVHARVQQHELIIEQ